MPSDAILISFVSLSFVFALVPGPNFFFLMAKSAQHGPWSAWCSSLGVEAANLVFSVLTAAGLGAVIATSALVFLTLKWAGVGYLCWLGFQALRTGAQPNAASAPARRAPKVAGELRSGFLLGIANPKVVLFFLAFLPQFVRHGSPAWEQLLVLGIAFGAVGMVCDVLWCGAAGLLRRIVAPRMRRPWTRRTPAFAYFGLAGWAATTGQHSS